jgi:type IV secretory pathway protease TraF
VSRMSTGASLRRSPSPRRCLAAVAAFAVIGGIRFFRFVLTPSLPRGMYLALPVGSAGHGDIVAFCPPEALGHQLVARRLVPPGRCRGGSVPLAKRIAAVAPWACARPEGVLIDGRLLPWPSLPGSLDLPRFGGCGAMAADCAFVIGDSSDSTDSRSFGFVALSSLRDRLLPVLTERSAW